MITIYWCCNLCGEAGTKVVQIFKSTPIDPTQLEVDCAKNTALLKIQIAHNSGGCPGRLYSTSPL